MDPGAVLFWTSGFLGLFALIAVMISLPVYIAIKLLSWLVNARLKERDPP